VAARRAPDDEGDTVYSKVKIAGHPVHPMLIVYTANGSQFWLNLAIALSVAGAGSAILAAVPGLADWALGIPRRSAAKLAGLAHAGLNVSALGLFGAIIGFYVRSWNSPASPILGLALSAAGVALTLMAGFLGWMMVQDYHVGVRLAPGQQSSEPEVQQTPPTQLRRHRAA
jgi:uncharacterized membrane protein